MRGRPPVFDLTHVRFGALEVLGKTKDDPPMWDCKCDCGLHISLRTEQLRWRNKRDCGCGVSVVKSVNELVIRVPRSYTIPADLKDLVPASVMKIFGPPSKRPCSICGETPGRRVMPVYGVLDRRFLELRGCPDAYLTICGLCYLLARANKLCRTLSTSPENWYAAAEKRLEAERVRPVGLLGMFRMLLTHQSDEERVSPQGMKVRELAEIALEEAVSNAGGTDSTAPVEGASEPQAPAEAAAQ